MEGADMSVTVIGTGSYLPARQLTNHDIEAACHDWDASRAGSSLHDWMMGRAGVAVRHRVTEGEATASMALAAASAAIEDAGIEPGEVDLLVLSTFTSDFRLPQSVSLVQRDLGISAKCVQIEAACAGFIDGFITAAALMGTGAHRTALVIHSETVSSLLDDEAFLCQSLFGDGAGAVVIRDDPTADGGLQGWCWNTDGELCDWTLAPGGGSAKPFTAASLDSRDQYLSIQAQHIFPYAVERMVEAIEHVLTKADVHIEDVDLLVPHQAGRNIILEVADRLHVDLDRVMITVERTGNVSGASIPIALDEANRQGRLAPGDRLVLPAVGGGMAWGALHLIWTRTRSGTTRV
jgi:3-oxoacyl-[acyl-carrier-protein] synthase-3